MNWQKILAALVGLSFIVGTVFAVDNHYAKQGDHQQLAKAFKQYVSESRQDKIQERVWDLEDRLRETKDKKEKEQLERRIRELKVEQEKVQRQIKEDELKK